LAGTGEFLKSKNKNIKICLTDPKGAALFRFYTEGVLKAEGSSITEGIGQGRVTKNLEGFTPDLSYEIGDEEAIAVIFDLLKYEGLCMGTSTGINVAGAIRVAQALGPGHTIVTMLCDLGTKYQTRLFNIPYLKEKNLPLPDWMDKKDVSEETKEALKKVIASEEEVKKAME